jgi:hypothetical protein
MLVGLASRSVLWPFNSRQAITAVLTARKATVSQLNPKAA